MVLTQNDSKNEYDFLSTKMINKTLGNILIKSQGNKQTNPPNPKQKQTSKPHKHLLFEKAVAL